jgi:hypothetical protein
MLMQLHVNGDDDAQADAKAIRKRLETNGGRPQARRARDRRSKRLSLTSSAQRYATGGTS